MIYWNNLFKKKKKEANDLSTRVWHWYTIIKTIQIEKVNKKGYWKNRAKHQVTDQLFQLDFPPPLSPFFQDWCRQWTEKKKKEDICLTIEIKKIYEEDLDCI